MLKENVLDDYGFGIKILDADGQAKYIAFWQYNDVQLVERYHPVGVEDLLQLVNEDPRWNGHLQDVYEMLSSVIETIGSGYDSYMTVDSGIEEGDSNYYYLYADLKSKKVYTNKKEYSNPLELEENVKKMKKYGKYVVVRPKLSEFESNLSNEDALTWSCLLYTSASEKEAPANRGGRIWDWMALVGVGRTSVWKSYLL